MNEIWNPHGTTILGVRRNGAVAVGADGQVTLGNTVMKGNARKVRTLGGGKVLAGFAGGTADAFTLFERFEGKLDKHGNLTRAAIEIAKDWRSDRYLRRLEALLWSAIARSCSSSNSGDVIGRARPRRDRLGRPVCAGCARARRDTTLDARSIVERSASPPTSASTRTTTS